uniref:CX domain-containing protein n=1 Tax=Panagrolaimus davidi TaxID=227884 RepID=A0A914QKX1_9BILA
MLQKQYSKPFWLLIILCLLLEPVSTVPRRSGGGFGMGSRGSSAGRSLSSSTFGRTGGSGFGFGRGNTGSTSHGLNSGHGYSSRNNYGHNSGGFSNTGYNRGGGTFGGINSNHNRGGTFGGLGGGHNRGSTFGGFGSRGLGGGHSYSRGSGIGSALRSNTFKNMLVGAAAGYMTYQAGKYLIRSAMSPMMWNNRPYYWGSNYYQARPNMQMCRMPVDSSDPTLGNVYFSDQSRPREITWGCGMGEHCCGYECCPNSGMGGGMSTGGGMPMGGGSGMPSGMSSLPAYCKVDGTGIDVSLRPAQSVGVRGTLKCNGMPAAGVLVKIYDHDTFTLDDLIAEGRTDGQGNFCIAGHANEITTITPKFNIYHDCNDLKPCQRKLSMYVPKTFITAGKVPYNIYDTGVMELAAQREGEERDCIHK